MNSHSSWFRCIMWFSLAIFSGLLAGCSDDDSSSPPPANTESLRIYEMIAGQGSFTEVPGDTTATEFHFSLSSLTDMLYFTNRGAQEAGYDTVDNVINNIWPRVYGTDAPNAVMKATTPDQDTIALFCILDEPLYDKATGTLDFTITYLDGGRPVDNLALTDVKMIIVNNAAQVQPQVWSTLMGGDAATLEPTGTAGVYTLYMEGVIGDLYDFTCAPHRHSRIITLKDYIDSWEARFAADPPNATIAYNLPDNPDGGAQVVVLTDPIYDEDANSISFTAERLFGTEPIKAGGLTVNNPSLFIDGGDGGFPTPDGNIFSIQYRNSTKHPIIVWLDGSQPPCSKAQAANCNGGKDPAKYSEKWTDMKNAFEASGTKFSIHKPDGHGGKTRDIDVLNHIELQPQETLRIVPPIVNGIPEWYYKHPVTGKVMTAGVANWVTKTGVSMPSVMKVNKFEYNLGSSIWADMGGVDGINVNVNMAYEGKGCGTDTKCGTGVIMPRVCKTNIKAYKIVNGKSNDGCPYIMTTGGANTCPNPNQYPIDKIPTTNPPTPKPSWVVAQKDLTTADVENKYKKLYYDNAKKAWDDKLKTLEGYDFGGRAMASAPVPDDTPENKTAIADLKKAYHVWWATNPAGQGWLNYLQKNANGRCDQYGWAFDEKKWKPGDTFDANGNPPDNTGINPLWHTSFKKDTYINIDILDIM